MNKSYRLIWSHHQQSMIVVGEHTRGRGKQGDKAKTLAMAVAMAVLSFSGTVEAACDAGPNTFACSGAETSTLTLSGSPLNLTLDPTFSMNAAAGNGLVVTGTNGLTVTQAANGGNLTAQGTALDVRNTGASGTGVQVLMNGNLSGYVGVITINDTGPSTIDVSGIITVTGTGTFNRGIYALSGVTATDMRITTADVTGGSRGVWTFNQGVGSLTIDTTAGSVLGATVAGVWGQNRSYTNTFMTITTADVYGGVYGITTAHSGTGSLTIDSSLGTVTGVAKTGVGGYIYNTASTGNLTITTADVNSNDKGIWAYQAGTGATVINTTAGTVTSTNATGILAEMLAGSGNLTITTADVTGGQYGIRALNNGIGSTTIDTTGGTVITTIGSNYYSAAIVARTSATSTDLTITTAAVDGTRSGIRAYNLGTGLTTIDTTRGTVTGDNLDGVFARNGYTTTDLTITTANVTANQYGVGARNYGTGLTVIDTTRGAITARNGDGVSMFTSNTAANVTITTADVFGGTSGMVVYNFGNGSTTIDTTRGSVSGGYFQGINAQNDPSTTDLTITTANVTGVREGILARNSGTGSTSITVASGGVVQGGTAGISAAHASANPFTITINGEVRNSSGLASDLALAAASSGAGLTLQNNSNTIIGTINLTAADDTFNNVGSWFTENGTSDFGGGNDVLNNTGLIRAANNAALAETTRFNNLELFNHSGIATLQDGAVGDRLITSGNFVGNNGEVRLDTVLDTGTGGSDILEINGNATGTARLRIANAGGAGGQTTGDGIRVVQVNGTSTANAFSLAAPAKAGIWNYALDFGGANNTDQNWYLVSQGFNEVGAIYESAPRILIDMLNPISTLQQRVGQRLVYGEDAREGAWMRAIGEWRDTELRHSTAGSRWDADSSTLQLGYDRIVSETVKGEWALGLTAHYNRMDADIKNPSGRGSLDSEGYGAGLTATWYGNQGSYVDLQAAISCTSTDFASQDLGTLAKNRHGQIYTLSAEAGHRIALNETQTLIPQLQLQTKRLRSDNFTDQLGSRVDLGNESVTEARLGVAWELSTKKQDRLYLIGNLLHDFNPETRVMVDGMRLDVKTASTAAEIGFGGTVSVAQNTVLYGEGKYRRDLGSSDSDAYGLTTGLRWSW